ncbi:hypothetical protein TSOC_004568 [Tetrabaena socialis]|uniref:Uncharacterized protein n=1 Tax=Tetrabaena socialis TaxID=47790 RepID=A0A2J8A8J1_9CHLO|nr:hypothetical protein TSOC_004568 [Tetrabaena socialis]|eukprot:PNH08856.1 hypothetical protein TSOC_004568 [Tetrabaena socialis]
MATMLARSSLAARCCRRAVPFSAQRRVCVPAALRRTDASQPESVVTDSLSMPALATLLGVLMVDAPAQAQALEGGFTGVTSNSLYVTLALFLMSVPGIWSQVKRAPQSAKKRLTFEVPGPSVEGAMSLDERAGQIFRYFKRYNYTVKETGEVITFEGIYAADKGQAAAVTFYTFIGLASVALVLATLVPSGGNWWYGMTLISPAAYVYYMSKGTRPEQEHPEALRDRLEAFLTSLGVSYSYSKTSKFANFINKTLL